MASSYLDEDRLRRSIAAIATAVGAGAIGIVRISGGDAINLGARVFSRPGDITSAESHTIHFGSVRSQRGEAVDHVLALVMRAPKTYTGENTIEFHAHGGGVQVERVLRMCVAAGALPALPGEFTFRAFMNGKVDLTQAEAVADMIGAQTDVAARVALEQSDGMLRRKLDDIRDRMVHLRARCEASIDFVDDDIPATERPILLQEAGEANSILIGLIGSFEIGRLLREGARVVLSGAPNVGKSSIFNALLRSDRAIVTEIPGTTRDAVTESVIIGDMPVILADTAGLRESDDVVEREGVARGEKYRDAADLVLEVVDASEIRDDKALSDRERSILVVNKVDLVDESKRESIRATSPSTVLVSAKTGEGMEALCQTISARLIGSGWSGDEPVVMRRRQFEGLSACREAVARFVQLTESNEPLELAALELRTGLGAIDELVGRVYDEEVLNRIFGEFCIGK